MAEIPETGSWSKRAFVAGKGIGSSNRWDEERATTIIPEEIGVDPSAG
jgi:hypothetical protein